MKRLYYLTKSINVAEEVSDRLHENGITDWNFHVLGKDKATITRHHLHTTNSVQESNVVRSSERGLIVGLLVGIGITTVQASIHELPNMFYLVSIIVLCTGFGAWLAGLIGASAENSKIKRFHNKIEEGYFLIMIDVLPEQYLTVKELMSDFDHIREAGEDTTVITPLSA